MQATLSDSIWQVTLVGVPWRVY